MTKHALGLMTLFPTRTVERLYLCVWQVAPLTRNTFEPRQERTLWQRYSRN